MKCWRQNELIRNFYIVFKSQISSQQHDVITIINSVHSRTKKTVAIQTANSINVGNSYKITHTRMSYEFWLCF